MKTTAVRSAYVSKIQLAFFTFKEIPVGKIPARFYIKCLAQLVVGGTRAYLISGVT